MSPGIISSLANVKALTFDVFGTVVDWKSSVTEELILRSHRKINSEISPQLKSELDKISGQDWEKFALEWRGTYAVFTRSFNPQADVWKTVDQHLHDSLIELLEKWNLKNLYTATEIKSLSLVWHRLRPWDDSPGGLKELSKTHVISTLSNGNTELLRDLDDFGDLGFDKFLSAEDFKVYKPNPIVYRGAARKLGFEPGEVAMVAAHLFDLEAASKCGLKTIYIERSQEESFPKDGEQYQEAKKWVDIWISEDQNGIEALARELKKVG